VGVIIIVAIFTIRETSYYKRHVSSSLMNRSQIQWMSLTVGFNRDASFIQALLDILAKCRIPAFDLVLVYHWNICWLVRYQRQSQFSINGQNSRNTVVQLMSSRTFTKPLYNWELGDLGLLSLAEFIGSILAFYVGGRLIDIVSRRSTARHGGVRKSEYRLPAVVIPGVVGSAGILIFGLCIAHKTHWIGPAVGTAMQAFGVAAISNVAVTYSLDLYKKVCTV
jgi:MFS family permease